MLPWTEWQRAVCGRGLERCGIATKHQQTSGAMRALACRSTSTPDVRRPGRWRRTFRSCLRLCTPSWAACTSSCHSTARSCWSASRGACRFTPCSGHHLSTSASTTASRASCWTGPCNFLWRARQRMCGCSDRFWACLRLTLRG